MGQFGYEMWFPVTGVCRPKRQTFLGWSVALNFRLARDRPGTREHDRARSGWVNDLTVQAPKISGANSKAKAGSFTFNARKKPPVGGDYCGRGHD